VVKLIGDALGIENANVSETVSTLNARLLANSALAG
jgi:hypothetical protein